MIYVERKPTPPLGEFVETIFHLKGYCPEHEVERIVPDTSINLVFELDNQPRWVLHNDTLEKTIDCRESWVSGTHRNHITITTPKNTELLAVRFHATGMFALLNMALSELTGRVVPASTLFGQQITALRNRIVDASDSESKLDLVEQWLLENTDLSLVPPAPIKTAIESIQQSPNIHSLKSVVAESGYSRKQFIHLFKKHTGLAPKDFQRILRFNQVLARIGEGSRIDWASLSIDCGYSDQSHFIKDFRNFSGLNPASFLDIKGDRSNFFPVEQIVDDSNESQ